MHETTEVLFREFLPIDEQPPLRPQPEQTRRLRDRLQDMLPPDPQD